MGGVASLIDEVIDHSLGECLRARAFVRKRRTFYRTREGVVGLVAVQASVSNTAGAGKFTVNVGLFFPAIDEVVNGRKLTGLPTEPECTIRSRLGLLMPLAQDVWWTIDESVDRLQLAEEVSKAWREFGQPWLDRHEEPLAAQQHLLKWGQFREAAAFSLLRKDSTGASQILEKGIASTRDPVFQSMIKSWARSKGLALAARTT
jgi:hypothetical protein